MYSAPDYFLEILHRHYSFSESESKIKIPSSKHALSQKLMINCFLALTLNKGVITGVRKRSANTRGLVN